MERLAHSLPRIEPYGGVRFDLHRFGRTPQYSPGFCAAMNALDDRAHDDKYLCEWVSPFGFVPECGCPQHDDIIGWKVSRKVSA
jgi:hypothetical protein